MRTVKLSSNKDISLPVFEEKGDFFLVYKNNFIFSSFSSWDSLYLEDLREWVGEFERCLSCFQIELQDYFDYLIDFINNLFGEYDMDRNGLCDKSVFYKKSFHLAFSYLLETLSERKNYFIFEDIE